MSSRKDLLFVCLLEEPVVCLSSRKDLLFNCVLERTCCFVVFRMDLLFGCLLEMNAAQGITRDVNPSPMSSRLIVSQSTDSLASHGSFSSQQVCGSRGALTASSSQNDWSVSPSASEAAALNANDVQHSNGFVCEDQDSLATWYAFIHSFQKFL